VGRIKKELLDEVKKEGVKIKKWWWFKKEKRIGEIGVVVAGSGAHGL
jgi:hypothetical protein